MCSSSNVSKLDLLLVVENDSYSDNMKDYGSYLYVVNYSYMKAVWL